MASMGLTRLIPYCVVKSLSTGRICGKHAVAELADIIGGGTPDRKQSEFWRDGTGFHGSPPPT